MSLITTDKLIDVGTYIGSIVALDSFKASKLKVDQPKIVKKGAIYVVYRSFLKDMIMSTMMGGKQHISAQESLVMQFAVDALSLTAIEMTYNRLTKQKEGFMTLLQSYVVGGAVEKGLSMAVGFILGRTPANGFLNGSKSVNPSQESNQNSRTAGANSRPRTNQFRGGNVFMGGLF